MNDELIVCITILILSVVLVALNLLIALVIYFSEKGGRDETKSLQREAQRQR